MRLAVKPVRCDSRLCDHVLGYAAELSSEGSCRVRVFRHDTRPGAVAAAIAWANANAVTITRALDHLDDDALEAAGTALLAEWQRRQHAAAHAAVTPEKLAPETV